MKTLPLWLAVLLPLAATAAGAGDDPKVIVSAERDSEWNSYRHAYKAAAFFAYYTRSRPLIQAHMQIRPLDAATPLDGLSLHLVGEKTDTTIAVDAIGRAELPMLKQAYQDDAVLRLNRQKGSYYFSGRYSIREHADGVYDLAELRAACEQLIGAQRESGYRMRLSGKQCLGIKFVYPAGAAPEVRIQTDGPGGALPLVDAHPFEGNSMGIYKVALYRYADWPQQGKILTLTPPLAIGTLYN
ncbi:hypothetical protein RugamoR64_52180 [Duganella rhizosphaerae]|uniref:hypothetical protein n=1 Tax=Duganella rhizosphaerae TaxID=2885763 RepID=UPI0030E99157